MGHKYPPAICLMGPTASGKTDLAMALCECLPCDIISVDSAMVYRGMDVGTAKPSADELARAPHRLIDILDPAESYSAAQFRRDALREMAEISARGRIPLLVGGTMLYLKALIRGIADLPPADPALRARLVDEAGRRGWDDLYQQLQQRDPEAARGIHPNNHQRLLRALEVVLLTQRPMSALWKAPVTDGGQPVDYTYWQGDGGSTLPYTVLQMALIPQDRQLLHQRIGERFRQMLDRGLVEEVRRLRGRGDLGLEMPSMRSVGYRQVWEYLDGKFPASELHERGAAATRQLAKRQLTWLRGWQGLTQIDSESPDMLNAALKIVEAGST